MKIISSSICREKLSCKRKSVANYCQFHFPALETVPRLSLVFSELSEKFFFQKNSHSSGLFGQLNGKFWQFCTIVNKYVLHATYRAVEKLKVRYLGECNFFAILIDSAENNTATKSKSCFEYKLILS